MKHTQGKWKVEQSKEALATYIVSKDNPNIAMLSWTTINDAEPEEREANARLISLAPECYKELKEAIRLINAYGFREPNNPTACIGWLTRAKQIINKAEGRI